MAQRVRNPHRRHSPSSARQLPILAALHAGFPTLFETHYTASWGESKEDFPIFRKNFPYFYLGMVMVSTIWLSVSRRSEMAGIPLS